MEFESWFKLKKYPHITLPITVRDYDWVKNYVNDKSKIKNHSFLPLLHKCISQRKFRADLSRTDRTPTKKRFRIKDKKDRHIFYASHLDSIIFSFYNNLLVKAYEDYIENKPFIESIVAYRKIAIAPNSTQHKCNIDFAKSVFEFIMNNKTRKLSVIVADITSFFDNLDHKILKRQWTKVLKEPTLPPDHYNVFKALTKIKYIEGSQLFKSYQKTMIVERGMANFSSKKEYKRKKINKTNYFKEKKAIAYCSKKEFLSTKLGLIISKNNTAGIPQGSPISATLANVYMLDFDENIHKWVTIRKGFYQRYSDDLIIVCDQSDEDEMIKKIRDSIASNEIANLEIQAKKTKIYRFEEIDNKYCGFEIDEIFKVPNYNRTLEYLGFSFDGERVLIKSAGFSKFYRSMIKAVKRSASLAMHSKNPDKKIFKSKLYKRFTYLGSERKLIYQPSKYDKKQYVKTKKFDWGNYLSYIKKANETMKTINKSHSIKKQSRRFWAMFNKLLKNTIPEQISQLKKNLPTNSTQK